MLIIDEKYKKKDVTLNDSPSKTKITIRNMSDDRMNGNTDLQEKFIKNHKDHAAENIVRILVKIF